jgi:hypothetical protein
MSKLKAKFPDRLDFYFAYVALSQLAAEAESTNSKTAEMDAKLANMFVTQAIQNIKKPVSLAPRGLHALGQMQPTDAPR